jgi:hypothetical protein
LSTSITKFLTDSEQAKIFIKGLDERYDDMREFFHKQRTTTPEKYTPIATVAEAIEMVSEFMSGPQNKTTRQLAAVYAVSAADPRDERHIRNWNYSPNHNTTRSSAGAYTASAAEPRGKRPMTSWNNNKYRHRREVTPVTGPRPLTDDRKRARLSCHICSEEHSYTECPDREDVKQFIARKREHAMVTYCLVNNQHGLSDYAVICDNAATKHIFGNIDLLSDVQGRTCGVRRYWWVGRS